MARTHQVLQQLDSHSWSLGKHSFDVGPDRCMVTSNHSWLFPQLSKWGNCSAFKQAGNEWDTTCSNSRRFDQNYPCHTFHSFYPHILPSIPSAPGIDSGVSESFEKCEQLISWNLTTTQKVGTYRVSLPNMEENSRAQRHVESCPNCNAGKEPSQEPETAPSLSIIPGSFASWAP